MQNTNNTQSIFFCVHIKMGTVIVYNVSLHKNSVVIELHEEKFSLELLFPTISQMVEVKMCSIMIPLVLFRVQ